MAFNLTGVDKTLYYNANVAVNVTLFTCLVLPPLILCMLCVLALVFTKEVNLKIRILLINIFAAETCNWLSYATFYLGWPILWFSDDITLCQFTYILYSVTIIQRCTAGAFYAIHIYIFIKHGVKKLKWYVIVIFIVTSWISATAVGLSTSFNTAAVINNHGFCTVNPGSASTMRVTSIVASIGVVFLIIQISFSVVTVVFVIRNTLEGSIELKKATTKVLAYLAAASILSFINNILPAIVNPIIRNVLPKDDIVITIAVYYLLRIVSNIPAIATPIVTIALFKPVRLGLKNMSKKACVCKPNNQVHPAAQDNAEVNDAKVTEQINHAN